MLGEWGGIRVLSLAPAILAKRQRYIQVVLNFFLSRVGLRKIFMALRFLPVFF